MSIKLAMPRVLRAQDQPITLEQVEKVAPAIFTLDRGVNTMPGYQLINTLDVVTQLMAMDYCITEVAQARSRESFTDKYSKHMVRLRQKKHFVKAKAVGDVVPEIIVVNAHNASSKLHLYGGLWRFLCANGLMVGDTIGALSMKHTGDVAMEVRKLVDQMGRDMLPRITAQVGQMKAKELDQRQRTVFAANAISLRWPGGTEAVATEDLLQVRREQDSANDVWTTYNVVQENLLVAGFRSRTTNRVLQRLEQVGDVVAINRALWDMAARIAA